MEKNNTELNLEKMNAPSYKLLLTAPMAAILLSGKSNAEWSELLKSIAPIYASAAEDTAGEVHEALLTASYALSKGDTLIRKYLENENLNFDRMMEISATGADIWMCKLSDGDVKKSDLIKLFKAIQSSLVETAGDQSEDNDMIDQLIKIQDKIIEHISSLN